MGPDGTLAHHEVVASRDAGGASSIPPCSSTGICVLRSEWSSAGVAVVWMRDDKIRRGDRALLTATTATEEWARAMVAPAQGCHVYFSTRYRDQTWADPLLIRWWGDVYFGMDDGPGVLYNHKIFSLWNLPAGQHTLHAMRKDGTEVENYPIDCRDGETTAIEGVVIPTVAGTEARAQLVAQALEDARESIANRRLLLLN